MKIYCVHDGDCNREYFFKLADAKNRAHEISVGWVKDDGMEEFCQNEIEDLTWHFSILSIEEVEVY